MRHQIEVDDLIDFDFEHMLASSVGRRSNKKLVVRVKGLCAEYRVYDQKELILVTANSKAAVRLYNDLD